MMKKNFIIVLARVSTGIFSIFDENKTLGFGEAVKILAAEAGMQPYRFSNFDQKKIKDFRFIKIFLMTIRNISINNYFYQKIKRP